MKYIYDVSIWPSSFSQFDWTRLWSSQSGICRRPWRYQPLPVLCLLIIVLTYARASIRPILRWETFLQVGRLMGLQRFFPLYRNRYGFPQIPLHFRSEVHVYHRHLTSWCLRSNSLFGFERVVTMFCSPFRLLAGFTPWGTMHVIGNQCLDV